MLLEYFQMIDRVVSVDVAAGRLAARAVTPAESPVFEGHFPGMPLVPGVLLVETMAQAAGFLLLAKTDFTSMPFLISIEKAKLRTFVEPSTELEVEAALEHEGSGYAVTKGAIRSVGKKVCNAELMLKLTPFSELPLGDIVRRRADEVGLTAALSALAKQEAR